MDLQENKDALNTAMEELKDVRDDVKRRVDEAENNLNEYKKCSQEVKGWLERVQVIEGEVVQVIQKADHEIQVRCFRGYCPKNCWSARKIGKLVIRKLATVNDLRIKGSFGDVAYKLPTSIVQKEPVDITVGMESMFDKVWRSIAEDEVRTMGLYGYGGVGKTTLLKQINNEFLKTTTTSTHGFDVVILVVVSKALNIDAIQKEIGNRLGLSSPNKRNIFNALTKKNFVLLLDDIWERVDLQSIGVPLVESSKSKVIFTTRDEAVCGLMDANKKFKVECLPWNEAWTLFQNKVGNEALNSDPKIPELAKVVAKKCGGLPLALITIGRAMSSKKTVQEWKRAITTLKRSPSEFPGMVDKVLHLLRLSYDSLDDETIKSCFLYCALFPKDYSINISRLVDYWIGEGLILLDDESDDIDDARNHGYNVIGILKGACLLETGKGLHSWLIGKAEEPHVKMHDTIQDLALWIKKDKMVVIATTSEHTSERLWSNAERVYYSRRSIDSFEKIVIAPPKSPNLRTLLFKDAANSHRTCSIPDNFFEFMPFLRVLDLSSIKMEIFPTSITELLELQYLNLSNTNIKVLPEELRKLVKLRHLDLSHMYDLKEMPTGVIGSLLRLRVLNLYKAGAAESMVWDIEQVYNLKHLNDLGIFINTQQNLNKLLNNQNLPKCVRHLGLRNIHDAELMNQQQHLVSCFQNLSQIEIYNCNALKHLTWVGYAGNLNKVSVFQCKELEEIVKLGDGFDFGGASEMNKVQDVFERLEILSLWSLPKLKSICRNALGFPCLKFLDIRRCPHLKKLPFDSASNINNTLQRIEGGKKWWDRLQWEDHDNVKSKFLPYFFEYFNTV